MFKKAGIVVGVTIILIACLLYWWVGKMDDKKVEEVTPTTEVTDITTVTPSDPNTKTEVVEPLPVETQPTVVETPTLPVEEQKQVFSILDEGDLGEPLITRTEIMVVSKKKVVLMDSAFGTDGGKQLLYAVDLMYGEGLMTLYLNGVVYTTLNVGDKLQVDYKVFKNDKGVSFPTITSVDTVQ